MARVWLQSFAAACVEAAEDEAGHCEAEVDEIVHGRGGMLFHRQDACSPHPAELKAGRAASKMR